MLTKLLVFFLLLATAAFSTATKPQRELKMMGGSGKGSGKGGSGKGGSSGPSDTAIDDYHYHTYYKGKGKGKGRKKEGYHIYLDVVNLAFQQPFSEFFVMVHDATVEPLFTLGFPASEPLQVLAEEGNATDLVEWYKATPGVLSADIYSEGAPYFVGQEVIIPVWVNRFYPYVTIAAMAINTNDAFVAINGMALVTGDHVTSVGYDAGSEVNNQECESVPGPACPASSGNIVSGDGEGVVHVSRGIHDIGDLAPEIYDWRNPMMLVNVLSK